MKAFLYQAKEYVKDLTVSSNSQTTFQPLSLSQASKKLNVQASSPPSARDAALTTETVISVDEDASCDKRDGQCARREDDGTEPSEQDDAPCTAQAEQRKPSPGSESPKTQVRLCLTLGLCHQVGVAGKRRLNHFARWRDGQLVAPIISCIAIVVLGYWGHLCLTLLMCHTCGSLLYSCHRSRHMPVYIRACMHRYLYVCMYMCLCM
jgi:hypothetical protein